MGDSQNSTWVNYLSSQGAIFSDQGLVPAHFGDPFGEQLKYESGAGLAVFGQIGVVKVTGPDRLSWLTTLSSQLLTGLADGNSAELLILSPQGRIEFAAAAVEETASETVWLMTEPEESAGLAQYLESMKFMLRVEIEEQSADYVAFGVANFPPEVLNASSATEDLLATQDFLGTYGVRWIDAWPNVVDGGAQYFQGDHPGVELRQEVFLVRNDEAVDFIEGWLAVPDHVLVGELAAEASRVAAWRPRKRYEVDHKAMPAELDWLRTAVHLNKGCYRGQESVARIINLGKPPRRLTFLQLDGSLGSIPRPGDKVEWNGRPVGVITSVARHAQMGPIALALLKRNLDPTAQLNVGDIAAAQELIVSVEGRAFR